MQILIYRPCDYIKPVFPPPLGRMKQNQHEFEVSLDYTVTLRPAWAVQHNFSSRKKCKLKNK